MKRRIFHNCRVAAYIATLSLTGCITNEKQALFYEDQADLYLFAAITLGVVSLITVFIAFRQRRTSAWIHIAGPAVVAGALAAYAGTTSLDCRLEARRYACAALSQTAQGTQDPGDCRKVLADWDIAKERELIAAKQKEHARLEKIIQ